jgi:hypothetical protein
MDFIVFSSLVGATFSFLVLSYDIMCQWSRNLPIRMLQLPTTLQLPQSSLESLKKVIPKLHIQGHGKSCQTTYSLNYLKYSARTDGEEPERWWAHINPVSMSTREMGPGARQDTIDDHASAWNWKKLAGFGVFFATRMRTAIRMQGKHIALHAKLTARFPLDLVSSWEAEVVAWEIKSSKKNPYEELNTGITLKAVQTELAKEELEHAQKADILHDVLPNRFISAGLEIEEQQRVLAHQISQLKKGAAESLEHLDKRNILQRRIDSWQLIQDVYMPGISELRTQALLDKPSPPESIPLYLPSSVPSVLRSNFSSLTEKEARIRIAQAEDALSELRRLLRITMGLWHYKFTQVGPSQRSGTRARSLINRFKDKIFNCAESYRSARNALLSLDPSGTWIMRFHELKPEDIRAPGKEDDEQEGNRSISWIWLTSSENHKLADDTQVDECMDILCFINIITNQITGLRVEWMKSRARAERWSEEVLLVEEEMRRTLAFLDWKALWWIEQSKLRQNASSILQEGCTAYATKQADVLHIMAFSFAKEWQPILEAHGMSTLGWPATYVQSFAAQQLVSEKKTDMVAEEKDEEFDDDDIFF